MSGRSARRRQRRRDAERLRALGVELPPRRDFVKLADGSMAERPPNPEPNAVVLPGGFASMPSSGKVRRKVKAPADVERARHPETGKAMTRPWLHGRDVSLVRGAEPHTARAENRARVVDGQAEQSFPLVRDVFRAPREITGDRCQVGKLSD